MVGKKHQVVDNQATQEVSLTLGLLDSGVSLTFDLIFNS